MQTNPFPFPEEILEIIFSFFSAKSAKHLTPLSLVCKSWNQISSDNQFWIPVYHNLRQSNQKTTILTPNVETDRLEMIQRFVNLSTLPHSRIFFISSDIAKKKLEHSKAKNALKLANLNKSKKKNKDVLVESTVEAPPISSLEPGIVKKSTLEFCKFVFFANEKYGKLKELDQKIYKLHSGPERQFWSFFPWASLLLILCAFLVFCLGWTRCAPRMDPEILATFSRFSLCFEYSGVSTLLYITGVSFLLFPLALSHAIVQMKRARSRMVPEVLEPSAQATVILNVFAFGAVGYLFYHARTFHSTNVFKALGDVELGASFLTQVLRFDARRINVLSISILIFPFAIFFAILIVGLLLAIMAENRARSMRRKLV